MQSHKTAASATQTHTRTKMKTIIETISNHPYLSASLWILSGLYGLYLSTWNTRSHKERFKLIMKWQAKDFRQAPLYYLSMFITLASALGPIWYFIAKASYIQYCIRQQTLSKNQ